MKKFNVRFQTYRGAKFTKKLSARKRRMFKVISKKKKLRPRFQCTKYNSYEEYKFHLSQQPKERSRTNISQSEYIIVPDFFNDVIIVKPELQKNNQNETISSNTDDYEIEKEILMFSFDNYNSTPSFQSLDWNWC